MKYKVGLALSLVMASVLMGETFELGKIEVSDAKEIGYSSTTTVLDSQTMQDNERTTVVDALNTLSGISIQNGGGRNEQMVMVRGFDVKHAPLFIDGIPIAVPYDGYVDFSRFTTYDLSQIEVSKGLTSVLLGPNTFAGAINMVTKKPTKAFEGEVGVGVFSGNGKDGYITAGTNQGSFYGIVSLSGSQKDSYPLSGDFPSGIKYEDGGSRNNSASKDGKVNLKVGYTPNNSDEYSFNYIKQHATKDVPPFAGVIDGTIIKDSNPNTSGGGTVHFWKWDYWDKESYYFLSKTDFDNWYVKTRAYYDIFQNSLLMYTDPTYSTLSNGGSLAKASSNPSFYDDNTKGVSVETGVKLFEADTLKFALHYKEDTHKEGSTNGWTKAANPEYTMQDDISSFGVEYKRALTNSTALIVGTSYDWEKAQKAPNTNYGATGNYFSDAALTTPITSYATLKNFDLGEASSLNPMAKLETKIDETTSIYGGISKKSRIPSIKDRYSFKMGNYVPNPDLQEESIVNYEIGGTKSFDLVTFKAALFYADIRDYIQSAYVPIWYKPTGAAVQQQQLKNIGEVSEKGIELEASFLLADHFSFDGSYTYLDMKNETDSNVKITDVPKHKFFASTKYEFTKSLAWILSYEYDSERFTSYVLSGSNIYYSSGDASIWGTKLVYNPTKELAFEAGVKNLFDENYYVNYGYPEAGRVFYGNVKYKF
ncbi:TonB-dependent receptor plug domain-containing protein [Sulfurospirillum oryzae]|uniref:TonB-dependent receptor plug domain-containing protein n=1 Tax=Sulfurospirillum oryzae TaxID=2976535 RepID=UPI0021E91D51|nr:TonB-dependent receptor [Sulfurospirillum oryzae]